MNVLILGAGHVGYNIAKSLVAMHNSYITVVDQDERALNRISEDLDIRPVTGYAAHPNVLEQAGAQQADALIAVTNNDEVNIVACEMAHSLFKVPVKIARIRDRFYLQEKYRSAIYSEENVSIDYIISPEADIARMMSHSLQGKGTMRVMDILNTASLMSVRCTEISPILNTPLKLLFNLFPSLDVSVVTILRQGHAIVPKPQDTIQRNDQVYFVVPKEQIPLSLEAFGYEEQVQNQIILGGGGNISQHMATEILALHPTARVKVIEKNLVRDISNFDNKIDTILGDVCDPKILLEAGVESCDTFVAVTNDDKTNLLSSFMAKHYHAKSTMTLLSDKSFMAFAQALGIDTVIDPNFVTVSTVLRYIKQNRLRSLYSISGVEIIEIDVSETSHLIGLSTTEDLRISGQIIVAALQRGQDEILFPENYIVHIGDKLIMAVTQESLYKIEKLAI